MRGAAPLVMMAAAFALGACAPRPPAGVGPGYRLVWSDEFDGTVLDKSKWSYGIGPRRDAVNEPEAVTLNGQGHLVITTSKHEVEDASAKGGRRVEYRTGMISTRRKFETTYGYFECRMKVQTQPGHWSAFWINTPTMGRPKGNPAAAGVEIDVIEYLKSEDYADKANHTIHWDHKKSSYQRDWTRVQMPEIGEGFHTFGCEWTDEYLAFYINGRETWRTSAAIPKRRQYLIISLEVGQWAGDIAAAELPDGIVVDYVRVWKKLDEKSVENRIRSSRSDDVTRLRRAASAP